MKILVLAVCALALSCANKEEEENPADAKATCVSFYQYRKFISSSGCSGSFYLDSYNVVDKTYCFENYPVSLCKNSVTCTPSAGGSPYSSYSRTQHASKPSCASLGYAHACGYGFAANAANCFP